MVPGIRPWCRGQSAPSLDVRIRQYPLDRGAVSASFSSSAALSKANIREDLVKIYDLQKIRAKVLYRTLKDERVDLFFILPPVKRYDRHSFKGMEHLTETEARHIAGVRVILVSATIRLSVASVPGISCMSSALGPAAPWAATPTSRRVSITCSPAYIAP